MKRFLALLSLLILLGSQAALTEAHSMAMVAGVTVKGKELVVRMLDAYGAPVQGAVVTASFGLPEGKPGKSIRLAESPAGVFRGPVSPPSSGVYEVTVEATHMQELFRSSLRVNPGEEMPEIMLPMAAIDEPEGFDWSTYLYIGAIIILVTATAMALLRKREPGGAEET